MEMKIGKVPDSSVSLLVAEGPEFDKLNMLHSPLESQWSLCSLSLDILCMKLEFGIGIYACGYEKQMSNKPTLSPLPTGIPGHES